MWLILKVHKETSELFIQTGQFVIRGKISFRASLERLTWIPSILRDLACSLYACKLQMRWTLGFGYTCTYLSFQKRKELEPSNYCHHGQKSWDTFTFVSLFVNSHLPNPSPPPPSQTPQTTLDVCIQNCFPSPQFQHCIGEGRENCNKISKRMHCFIRASINYRKLRIQQWLSQGHLSRIFEAFKSNGEPQNNFTSITMKIRNPKKCTGQKCIYSDKKMFIKRYPLIIAMAENFSK